MKKKFFFIAFTLFFLFGLGQNDNEKISQLMQVADSLSKTRNAHQALQTYLEAEQLASSLTNSLIANSMYYNIGLQYLKLGDDKSAIVYFKKSEILSKKIPNDSCYSMALHGLGLSYSKGLAFDTAIKYYEQSLQIQQEKVKDARTEAVILNGLAGVYITSGDLGNTLKFSRYALLKSKETDDYDLQANILNTISICLEKQGDYKEALSYKIQSLEVCEQNNLNIPLVLLANIGNNYQLLKETDSALYYYNIAKEKAIETKSQYGLARVNFQIGKAYQELKDYKRSLYYLENSYDHFNTIGDEQMLDLNSESISEVYKVLNNPAKSLRFLKEHLQWNDSIKKRSTDKKLEEFQVKYNTAEKEKEIALLDKENLIKTTLIAQEQKQKLMLWIIFSSVILFIGIGTWLWQRINKKRLLEKQHNLLFKSIIEAEQKERKRIAQDLHDSIGQSISVVKMQANALLSLSEEETLKHKKLLMQVDHVYDELRTISHHIMPNTLITLGLVPAIKELITEISVDSSLKIQLKNDSDFKDLNEDQTLNLFRIIQEALINTIKHAKASIVNIDLKRQGDIASVYIKDDGIGMDTSQIDALEGIGLKNIFSRVSLLSGDIEISSKYNSGTTIAIHLKTQQAS